MFKINPCCRGEGTKIGRSFCRYRDARSKLNPHVVAVTEENLSHLLKCLN